MPQVSRGMWLALLATLLLTVASYGFRQWRQISAESPTVEVAAPAERSAVVASPDPVAVPEAGQQINLASLRPGAPAANVDAMASRNAMPPAVATLRDPEQVPSSNTPVSPLPGFRLIGRYADTSGTVVFFAHDQQVIVARRGARLPGDFVLKRIRKDAVVLQRQGSQETTELRLDPP